ITPAVKAKLMPELCKPIMLSIADGADRPNYAVIVDALAENKASDLAKLLGEQSGVQTFTLSRSTPGNDGTSSDGSNPLTADAQARSDAVNK
ncbi:MAG: hypothetical protein JKX85_00170, partial [Phycisphaeraceae bacterium]|nr:hypothetical protein [Phycisphaeraceae bacterium]